MNIRKKTHKKGNFFLKRMLRIIRERMQTFAYVHQIGHMRILGTMIIDERVNHIRN